MNPLALSHTIGAIIDTTYFSGALFKKHSPRPKPKDDFYYLWKT